MKLTNLGKYSKLAGIGIINRNDKIWGTPENVYC